MGVVKISFVEDELQFFCRLTHNFIHRNCEQPRISISNKGFGNINLENA